MERVLQTMKETATKAGKRNDVVVHEACKISKTPDQRRGQKFSRSQVGDAGVRMVDPWSEEGDIRRRWM